MHQEEKISRCTLITNLPWWANTSRGFLLRNENKHLSVKFIPDDWAAPENIKLVDAP
jgi:hypothetical protein